MNYSMKKQEREDGSDMKKSNRQRAILFETPDYIPMSFCINPACWHHYPQEWLAEQMERHTLLFPGFQAPELPYTPEYPLCARRDEPFTDDFGCLWETTDDGITGTVVRHPLEDWEAYASYEFPDPAHRMGIGPVDWETEKIQIEKQRAMGELVGGGLRHGHTFLQLCDLRGYSNLMFDMADEEPLLMDLIEKLEAFNMEIVRRYLDLGVDVITLPEDLGMQIGPMLSPEHFRKYIKPSYSRMMQAAREKGVSVHMHSDGDIRLLIDDLLDSGVGCINLQDMVNGIDWIRERLKGKVCIDLDIDRQNVTRFGSPQEIHRLILEEVEQLGSPQGGLMMIYGLYPGVPPENVEALMDAMEKYAFYYR